MKIADEIEMEIIKNSIQHIKSSSSSSLLYTANPYRSVLDFYKDIDTEAYDVLSRHRVFTEIIIKEVRQ